jgi:hypothetical protein
MMQSKENKNKEIDISIYALGDYENFLKDAKEKKIHIACIASLDEASYCFKLFRELVPGLQTTEIKSIIEKVITIKDVGSLYPDAYLSFLPPTQDDPDNTDSNLTSQITELIFEANEKFIKSGCMVFLLDDNKLDYKRLSKAIEKSISGNWKEIRWLKKIILC